MILEKKAREKLGKIINWLNEKKDIAHKEMFVCIIFNTLVDHN